ncbi:MAG: DUF1559 domain-containing protein [Planctomycetes bacterium]|nr:DUF1559 domain-containing protein [Planctomycetota bacterium]
MKKKHTFRDSHLAAGLAPRGSMHPTREASPDAKWIIRDAHAFTLIELLVVVSIITLLIAILLPSLTKARDTARIVHCGANLHQIGIGVTTYSVEYKGYIPPYNGGGANPFVTYWMWDTSTPTKRNPVNLGHLFRYSKDPGMYFDVSLDPKRDSLAFNGPDNPWNDGQGDSIARLRSSYPARSLQFKYGTGTHYWRMDEFSHNVIYSDFVGVDNWNGGGIILGTINKPHRGLGYNRLFAEGAVRWISSQDVDRYRPVTNVQPAVAAQYNYYEQCLDLVP